jgi:site-specific DNA-methyltransferase (adenine-specific)
VVHPVLLAHGWEYRCCNIWGKDPGHIAGNVNTQTLRKFPIVTEVCVHYVKAATFRVSGQSLTMQEWLRHEWKRTQLPFRLANEACGVLNAATRKYLTPDHLWYYPPVDAFVKLAQYANEHGDPAGRHYFSIDGKIPIPSHQWSKLRAKFNCDVGVTNVWREPQVSGTEQTQGERNGMKYKFKSLHASQKPLKFIELIIRVSTEKGDVVWEPFGGLCPGAIIAYHFGRVTTQVGSEFHLLPASRVRSSGFSRSGTASTRNSKQAHWRSPINWIDPVDN